DISARDHADDFAAKPMGAEGARDRGGTSAFRDYARTLDEQSHGPRDVVQWGDERAIHGVADDRPHLRQNPAASDAIDEAWCTLYHHRCVRRERGSQRR